MLSVGLHTIVNLPPEDVNLWKSSDDSENQKPKKLRSSTAAERKAAKAECKFCWEHYEKMDCQFYKPLNRDFKVTTYRNGKIIVCECCDFTEDEEEEQTEEDSSRTNGDDKEKVVIRAGWFGKGEKYSSLVHSLTIENFQATVRFKRSVRNNPRRSPTSGYSRLLTFQF